MSNFIAVSRDFNEDFNYDIVNLEMVTNIEHERNSNGAFTGKIIFFFSGRSTIWEFKSIDNLRIISDAIIEKTKVVALDL